MCGLVGVIKQNMTLSYYSKFKDLMAIAQLRGDDGAGIISVPKGKDGEEIPHVNIKRTTWSSGHLVTLQDFDDVTKGDRSALFGHARQPTKGGSTLENVHPHRIENIILMHNGTMSHVGGKAVPQGKSDSKEIAKYLVDHPIEEFVDNSYGAYCLTWVDLKKQTINFIRNGERPLWFCEEKSTQMEGSTTDAFFWASELWMLQCTLARYPKYNKERMKYYQLPKDEHWEFPLNIPFSIPEPKITKCAKVIKSAVYDYGYSEHWSDVWDQEVTPRSTVTPPFNHAAGQNTNANLPVVRSSSATTSPGTNVFQYVPPEHRQPVVNVGTILFESQKAAMEARKKKEVRAQSAIFQEKTISDYACTDPKRVKDLVARGACVWCSQRPVLSAGTPTAIYPVRFAEDRREYICEDCISDVDVQRSFGFGT